MMKRHEILAALTLATALWAAGAAARASSVIDVSAQYLNDSPTDIVQITSAYLAPTGYNGGSFYAGASNFQLTAITSPGIGTFSTDLSVADVRHALGANGSNFVGYCI